MELLTILRLLHILPGVLWAGWAFALPLFIEPATRAAGPAGGAFMQALTGKTPLVKVMSWAPVLVITSGIWLLWLVSNGLDPDWLATTHGAVLFTGSILGISAFVGGMLFIRPLAVNMGKIGAQIAASGAPPTPEQQAALGTIRDQMRRNTRVIGIILALCVTCMSTARYLF